ncbi:MAG: hypothetical protein Q8918_04220 [Bacteroidota bacterium]|nr:hypothetical protein [Bacteroidota bacterium]
MIKRFLLLGPIFISFIVRAQLPEDALRLSNTNPSGTAREQAIGGAMGSLGGDISAHFVNPAGLGFYKTGEILISPGFGFQHTKSQYLSASEPAPNSSHFMLGTSGFVLSSATSPGKSTVFSFAINRSADFYSHTRYEGANHYSSGAEAYAEEYANSGLSIDDALGAPGASLSYGTRMALYTYLIDTATVGGITQVIAQPQKVLAAGGSLYQVNDSRTTGGITELSLGFASSTRDKWYLGAAVGIPIVNYQRTLAYSETDLSGNTHNDFNYYNYSESFSSKGAGVNLKVGAIFRPVAAWRIGLAVHTPTFYTLTDRLDAKLVSDAEDYHHLDSTSSGVMDNNSGGGNSIRYDLSSSWHFIASGSYVFGTGEDPKDRQGFITGDIEYITNKSPRFSVPSEGDYAYYTDNGYYDDLNNTVKNYYKNSVNFRLGGELKFNALAVRAGGSYSLSPYASSDIKASRATASAGLGYRNHGIFIDLTFVESFLKDASFPYRLGDKDNVYATVHQNTSNLILTVGFKF